MEVSFLTEDRRVRVGQLGGLREPLVGQPGRGSSAVFVQDASFGRQGDRDLLSNCALREKLVERTAPRRRESSGRWKSIAAKVITAFLGVKQLVKGQMDLDVFTKFPFLVPGRPGSSSLVVVLLRTRRSDTFQARDWDISRTCCRVLRAASTRTRQ